MSVNIVTHRARRQRFMSLSSMKEAGDYEDIFVGTASFSGDLSLHLSFQVDLNTQI